MSKERNMFVAEHFLSSIVEKCGQHTVSTKDGGTWYLQSCKFLKLDHHIHFLYTKMRKVLSKEQCSTLRIESKALMITFLVKRKNVMFHIKNWIKLFVDMYNKEVIKA